MGEFMAWVREEVSGNESSLDGPGFGGQGCEEAFERFRGHAGSALAIDPEIGAVGAGGTAAAASEGNARLKSVVSQKRLYPRQVPGIPA